MVGYIINSFSENNISKIIKKSDVMQNYLLLTEKYFVLYFFIGLHIPKNDFHDDAVYNYIILHINAIL